MSVAAVHKIKPMSFHDNSNTIPLYKYIIFGKEGFPDIEVT